MDWCSYALECMVRGCKEYKLGKYFSGPLFLMAIIYVNSTVSETVKVEKTVPAFKAWNSKLLLKREQEEIELGEEMEFYVDVVTEDVDATEDVLDKNEDFKSLDFEDNNENLEGGEIDGDKNGDTNKHPLKKGHNEETEGEEIGIKEVEGNKDKCEENKGNEEQQETFGESNEDESQNKAEHNESERIDNIGNLSLFVGQNTTVNAPVESIVNATEKRTLKPSSNFYDRRIKIFEPLSEEEKKLIEYIWSDNCPEGDIVFARKGLELECLWFLSLYPEIKVGATVIDAWSDVLNHEEKYRRNLSITSHVYCWTEMLVFFPCIKDSNHHYIICFDMKNVEIDIIDNISNDVEDILERYGAYAVTLTDSFINHLERHNHPSIFAIVNANPKKVPMKWKTRTNVLILEYLS
ncbi:hypothetical protein Tco_1352474 [Tanacetum coccineum]